MYSSPIKSSSTNNEIPSFEKNKTTVGILNDLFLANQLADRQTDEVLKIMKVLQKEYSAEGIEIYLL